MDDEELEDIEQEIEETKQEIEYLESHLQDLEDARDRLIGKLPPAARPGLTVAAVREWWQR